MAKRIPVKHGQEIEQHTHNGLPRELSREWPSDHGGISETSLKPYKQVKRSICSFNEEMTERFGEVPWNWHAADSSVPGRRATGCGSHAHLEVDYSSEEEKYTEWAIAYNTVVELAPVFAPFFRFDWENGFREGTNYNGHQTNIDRWASPQTTRLSQSTIESNFGGIGGPSRGYNSVTLNPSNGNKPITIEIRMNENHPTFALVGLHFLKRVIKWCIEEGWSPKFRSSSRTKEEMYDKIYDENLITRMKESFSFGFEDGRGIPGISQTEFDSMWDLFESVIGCQGVGTGAYDQRVKELVLSGEDENGPQNNLRAMWHVCDEEFSWDRGPEVK